MLYVNDIVLIMDLHEKLIVLMNEFGRSCDRLSLKINVRKSTGIDFTRERYSRGTESEITWRVNGGWGEL